MRPSPAFTPTRSRQRKTEPKQDRLVPVAERASAGYSGSDRLGANRRRFGPHPEGCLAWRARGNRKPLERSRTMQLTTHTDFALRVLIALGSVAPEQRSVREISSAYGISEHHVTKVVARLSSLGYVETQRGREGGCRLTRDPATISIGRIVRELEAELGVVACLREGEHCVITPVCGLKGALQQATEAFLQSLDGVTLADTLEGKERFAALLKLRSRPAPSTETSNRRMPR